MASKSDVFQFLTVFFSEYLQKHWDKITLESQTIDKKYGITRDTCQKFQVGFAPADVSLFDLLTEEFKFDHHVFISNDGFGFINIPTTNPFRAYNFFNGRLIFPYLTSPSSPHHMGGIKGGSGEQKGSSEIPFYFTGRITDLAPPDDFAKDMKFLHMNLEKAGLTERPLYLSPPTRDPCFLVEGHTHALILRQQGFAGVAIGAAKPNPGQIKNLKHTESLFWIPDVDILAATPQRITEDSKGEKHFQGAIPKEQKLDNILQTIREFPQCKLVTYPDDFADEYSHGDQTDWWLKYPKPDKFLKLIENPITCDDLEVLSIPKDSPSPVRTQRIDELLKRIAPRNPIESDEILSKLKNHLKLNNPQINHLRKEIKGLRSEGLDPPVAHDDFSQTEGYEKIHAGMDFIKDTLYYTVWKDAIVKTFKKGEEICEIVSEPFLISSNFDFFPFKKTELFKHHLTLPTGADEPNLPEIHWSNVLKTPYSIPNFLSNPKENTPDTIELFNNIRNYLKDFLYLTEDHYYDFATLFIFITYCIQIFHSFGYLSLQGVKSTGKSRFIEIIDSICFNPCTTSSSTDAYIFRTIEAASATMILDEVENFASNMSLNNTVSEKSLLVKGGYKKTGGVGRVEIVKDKRIPYKHRSFTCYVLANTRGLEPTMLSRSFLVPMVKCPRKTKLKSWNPARNFNFTRNIRNQLHCWALAHVKTILNSYNRINGGDLDYLMDHFEVKDREAEIWTPIFTLAIAIDELSGNPFKWDNEPNAPLYPQADETLFGKILNAQKFMSKKKHEIISEKALETLFLVGLRQMIKERNVTSHTLPNLPDSRKSNWYVGTKVRGYLNTLQGLKYYPKANGQASVKRLLLDTFRIITDEDIKQQRVEGHRGRPNIFRITIEKVDEICYEYEVPDDSSIETDPELEKDDSPEEQTEIPEPTQTEIENND